jgi:hypothetical protein
VVVCGALGLAAAVFATGAKHPSAYALDSTLVYRSEVGFVIFLALYLFVVFTRLAYYGRTPDSIGPSGARLPADTELISKALEELRAAGAALMELPEKLAGELATLRERIEALEQQQPRKSDHGQ